MNKYEQSGPAHDSLELRNVPAVQAAWQLQYAQADYGWEQAVRALRKNAKFGLALASGLTALVLLTVFAMRDVYQPVARIDIEPPTSGIKALHEIESATPAEDDSEYLETQVQILKSDALAVSVIRELHLENDPELKGGFSGGNRSDAASEQDALTVPTYLRDQFALSTLTPVEAGTLANFRQKLSVNPIKSTRLVEVAFASHVPQKAQRITNAVVSNFIESSYKQRYASTMQTSEWLSSQLSDLRKRVQESNQAVSDYQRKYGLVELDDRDVPTAQLMSEVNHQLSDAQAARIEAEAFVRMLDIGQGDSVPALRDDQFYQNLQMREADLMSQLAQAKTVYGDENTNIKRLQSQLAEVVGQMNSERTRASERLRTAYAAARERERLMLRNRESLRAQMGNVSSQLVGYHLLKNEAIAAAELYNTLQGRLREAGIYAGLRSTNLHVVDLATNLQRPTKPNRALLIAGGMLTACFMGILACFVKESFDNTLRTPEDIKNWIGMRSLALLPDIGGEHSRAPLTARLFGRLSRQVAVEGMKSDASPRLMVPFSPESEAVRDLRAALLSEQQRESTSVILISSSLEGEGKSTVAINLAAALAQSGRACLLDADLRRPKVSQAFGMGASSGFCEVLDGTAPLTAALNAVPEIDQLSVLPSGLPKASPADVLMSPRLDGIFSQLRKEFRYVVVDSPPVIRFSDARALARQADSVVMIGRYGITTRRALQRSTELLREVNAPLSGVVLNGINQDSADFHYFTYGYSRAQSHADQKQFPSSVPPVSPGDRSATKSRGAHA